MHHAKNRGKQGNPLSNTIKDTSTIMRNPSLHNSGKGLRMTVLVSFIVLLRGLLNDFCTCDILEMKPLIITAAGSKETERCMYILLYYALCMFRLYMQGLSRSLFSRLDCCSLHCSQQGHPSHLPLLTPHTLTSTVARIPHKTTQRGQLCE